MKYERERRAKEVWDDRTRMGDSYMNRGGEKSAEVGRLRSRNPDRKS